VLGIAIAYWALVAAYIAFHAVTVDWRWWELPASMVVDSIVFPFYYPLAVLLDQPPPRWTFYALLAVTGLLLGVLLVWISAWRGQRRMRHSAAQA